MLTLYNIMSCGYEIPEIILLQAYCILTAY